MPDKAQPTLTQRAPAVFLDTSSRESGPGDVGDIWIGYFQTEPDIERAWTLLGQRTDTIDRTVFAHTLRGLKTHQFLHLDASTGRLDVVEVDPEGLQRELAARGMSDQALLGSASRA